MSCNNTATLATSEQHSEISERADVLQQHSEISKLKEGVIDQGTVGEKSALHEMPTRLKKSYCSTWFNPEDLEMMCCIYSKRESLLEFFDSSFST